MSEPYSIPFDAVIEGDRARSEDQYGDIEGLALSLKKLGTIQPIVLVREPIVVPSDGFGDIRNSHPTYSYVLVAGGRRYRAMKRNGVKELWHAAVLDPQRMGFLFRDEVPEHVWREAELEENLRRLDMSWIDKVLAIYKIHRAKKDVEPKWGQEATGDLLGMTKGRVSYALRAAKALLAKDQAIMECTTLDEANCVFAKRAEDAALAELQRRNVARMPKPDTVTIDLASLTKPAAKPSFVVGSLSEDDEQPITLPSNINLAAPIPSAAPPIKVPLSLLFRHCDSIRDDSISWPKVNHIVTDIPYGTNMDHLVGVEDVKAEHDVDENIADMPIFLQKAYDAVLPGGFCVFFYDLDHHEKLQRWATEIGWRVQRWPYLAVKTSVCRNQSAQYNTTKNYETAMLLRRDGQTVLRRPFPSSWKTYDFEPERKLYNNPFAKPFDLWKDIYSMVAFPGQTVLDPYMGEGSACRAAVNVGLISHGMEIKEQHFNRGLNHMRKVYALAHNSNVEFT